MNLKLMMGAVALGQLLTGGSAVAATVFTDYAAWLAAVTGVTTDDFEENDQGAFTLYPGGYSGAGFTITPLGDSQVATVDPSDTPEFYDWNTDDVLVPFNNGQSFPPAKIEISAGSNFGFFFGASVGIATVTIGGTNYGNFVKPNLRFFGVTGAAGAVTVTGPDFFVIDNFSVASGVVVPEPSTWMLMILGFGLIARQLRRRHQTAVAV